MRLVRLNPRTLVLTNPVTATCISWQEFESDLAAGNLLPPLIVAPIRRNSEKAFIILDGNHRACVGAQYRQPVTAFLMTSATTPDEIMRLEQDGEIPFFPHKEYMAGHQTFNELVKEAIEAALQLDSTVEQMLADLFLDKR